MADISIIIPVLNEEDSILPLARELAAAFSGRAWDWECIWVDDGSTDQSRARLAEMSRRDPRHRHLILAKHAGQAAALWAGFSAAGGGIICTLDGDGQNDPADLPLFIDALRSQDADLVTGYRASRQDDWVRKSTSFIGNAARNILTGHVVKDSACAARAMRRAALMRLPFFHGMQRFFPTLFALRGCRIIEMAARHRPRLKGKAKYGVWNRLGPGLLDCFGVLWLRRRALSYEVAAQGGLQCEKDSGCSSGSSGKASSSPDSSSNGSRANGASAASSPSPSGG